MSETVDTRSHAALTDLAASLQGRLTTVTDPDWDAARPAWNLAVDQRPAAVAVVADAADVQHVLRAAGAGGLKVVPQGTGHLAAALGDLAGCILLRTNRLRELTVDPVRRVARVGAGVLAGELSAAAAEHGLAALVGSAHDVGMTGYTLAGGFSWLARAHGLAVNSVLAAELVTGDGELHRVDAQHEPDLFWAVRGSGGNVGVVTALELELLPVREVYAGGLYFPIERAAEVLHAYADWTVELSEAVTSCARLLRVPPLPDIPEPFRGRAFVVVDGAVLADPVEAEGILAPLRTLGPAIDTFATLPVSQLEQIHMDPPGPVPAVGDGLSISGLPTEAIDVLVDLAGPGTDPPLLLVDLRHLGGAVGRAPVGGGVVSHLAGQFLVYAVGIAPNPQVGAAVGEFVQAVRFALEPWDAGSEYGNFAESRRTPERFYRPEDLDRLRAVRAAHDPQGLVRPAHPVGV